MKRRYMQTPPYKARNKARRDAQVLAHSTFDSIVVFLHCRRYLA
jgi:hypothetical protein